MIGPRNIKIASDIRYVIVKHVEPFIKRESTKVKFENDSFIFPGSDKMGPIKLAISLLVLTTLAYCEDEVTVETIKHEDDIAYITPDNHPDVYFSDHFDHQVRLFTRRVG